jgi:hypothetical protein
MARPSDTIAEAVLLACRADRVMVDRDLVVASQARFIRLRCQSATNSAHETRMVEDRRTLGGHGERWLATGALLLLVDLSWTADDQRSCG